MRIHRYSYSRVQHRWYNHNLQRCSLTISSSDVLPQVNYTSDKIGGTMSTSYKIITIDILTSNANKNSTIYPRLLKAGFCYSSKKLFLLLQVGAKDISRSTYSLPSIIYLSNNFSLQFFIQRKKILFNL